MTRLPPVIGGGKAACQNCHSAFPGSRRRAFAPVPSARTLSHCQAHQTICGRRRDRNAALDVVRLTASSLQPAPRLSRRCRAAQSTSLNGILVGGATPDAVDQILPLPRTASSLPARALFGSLLGLAGGLIILTGGWLYTATTCLVVYQVCQEFQGFLTSKGISEGMEPPPPLVSALSSLLCVCFALWTHLSNGRATAALAVASFAVLSLQLLAVDKPHFSQLTSSVFGLFYCGTLREGVENVLDKALLPQADLSATRPTALSAPHSVPA